MKKLLIFIFSIILFFLSEFFKNDDENNFIYILYCSFFLTFIGIIFTYLFSIKDFNSIKEQAVKKLFFNGLLLLILVSAFCYLSKKETVKITLDLFNIYKYSDNIAYNSFFATIPFLIAYLRKVIITWFKITRYNTEEKNTKKLLEKIAPNGIKENNFNYPFEKDIKEMIKINCLTK